jgi:hypothetical protein
MVRSLRYTIVCATVAGYRDAEKQFRGEELSSSPQLHHFEKARKAQMTAYDSLKLGKVLLVTLHRILTDTISMIHEMS